jgi:hypothetical protein
LHIALIRCMHYNRSRKFCTRPGLDAHPFSMALISEQGTRLGRGRRGRRDRRDRQSDVW